LEDVTASFEYTREVMKSLDRQVREEVERLGGNPKLIALLDQLKVPEPSNKDGR
jgi:geranylgeranyl diphosphate synthase type 3